MNRFASTLAIFILSAGLGALASLFIQNFLDVYKADPLIIAAGVGLFAAAIEFFTYKD